MYQFQLQSHPSTFNQSVCGLSYENGLSFVWSYWFLTWPWEVIFMKCQFWITWIQKVKCLNPQPQSQSKLDLENQSNGEINPDRPWFWLLIALKLLNYHDFWPLSPICLNLFFTGPQWWQQLTLCHHWAMMAQNMNFKQKISWEAKPDHPMKSRSINLLSLPVLYHFDRVFRGCDVLRWTCILTSVQQWLWPVTLNTSCSKC